jgi:uncharacterized protein YcbK (DUF882 family)
MQGRESTLLAERKWIHSWLMDLVFVLHRKYNKDEIKILSGYRTPQTNAQLEGRR